MNIGGKNYYHIFTAGDYPQGNIDLAFLNSVINNYDPKSFHEAPVWIGHYDISAQEMGKDEPEALAWVESLLLLENKLYASFSSMSAELFDLIQDKKYKYVSVEFVNYKEGESSKPYLYAIAITNRPAVKGMEPLQFTAHSSHKFKSDFVNKITFNNSNKKKSMNIYLVKLAASVGVDASKFTEEDKLHDAVTAKFSELNAKIKTLEAAPAAKPDEQKTDESDPKIKKFADELASLKKARVDDLVASAISAKKILPENESGLRQFAEANYDAAKSFVEKQPVHPALAAQTIKDGKAITEGKIDFTDKKFIKHDGSLVTYADVLKDVNLQSKFTADELKALREASAFNSPA